MLAVKLCVVVCLWILKCDEWCKDRNEVVSEERMIWRHKRDELGMQTSDVWEQQKEKGVPPGGIEPPTFRLRSECSTTEL